MKKSIQFDEFKRISNISDEANDLLNGLLNKDQRKRMNINEIKDHPWIKGEKLNSNINFGLEKIEGLSNFFRIPHPYSQNNLKSSTITEKSETLDAEQIKDTEEIKGNDKEGILASHSIVK